MIAPYEAEERYERLREVARKRPLGACALDMLAHDLGSTWAIVVDEDGEFVEVVKND